MTALIAAPELLAALPGLLILAVCLVAAFLVVSTLWSSR